MITIKKMRLGYRTNGGLTTREKDWLTVTAGIGHVETLSHNAMWISCEGYRRIAAHFGKDEVDVFYLAPKVEGSPRSVEFPTFDQFREEMLRQITAALGGTYEQFAQNYTGTVNNPAKVPTTDEILADIHRLKQAQDMNVALSNALARCRTKLPVDHPVQAEINAILKGVMP